MLVCVSIQPPGSVQQTPDRPEHRIDSARSLESALHELIPISKAMGVHVVDYDGEMLRLAAPLANNINHQQSGFGGSLFSLAALAGWGILQLKLNELPLTCNTVIADGRVVFTRPVFADFECSCRLPPEYAAFRETLVGGGRATLMLDAAIEVNGKTAMTLTGRYVVTPSQAGATA